MSAAFAVRRLARPLLVVALLFSLFVPGAAAELDPVDVSPAGASAAAPRLASDGRGNLVAVWREVDDGTSAIRAAVRRAEAGWQPSRVLSAAEPGIEAPELAMDRLGNAVAVWHRATAGQGVVEAAVRVAGGDWTSPISISAPGEAAFNPVVSLEAGRATVVWIALQDRRTLVRSASWSTSAGWGMPATISGPVGNTYGPGVAMDDQGRAVAAWQWWDGGYLVIQAATRAAGGEWTPPQVLSSSGRSASRPQVAMDAAGNAIVGWLRSNGAWVAAQASYRAAGSTWRAPENLFTRGGNGGGLDLAMSRRGDVAAIWKQAIPGASFQVASLWSATRPPGAAGRWSARQPVTAAWRNLHAQIALDEAGNLTAVWAASATISASFKPVGEPWQDDYLVSKYDVIAAHPAVAMQNPQNATALWVRAAQADDRIQAVSYDINTAKEESDDDEGEEGEEGDEGEEEAGEVFKGTAKADRFVGTSANDTFYGLGGDDVIDGRGGNDTVYGGGGDDRLAGGSGRDRLFGGQGRNRISGGAGADLLAAESGADELRGGAGDDALYGFGGRDVLDCGPGDDMAFGGATADRLRGRSGRDRLFGGGGRDLIGGDGGSDLLVGGFGRDVLFGGAGDDALRARDGRTDHVWGGRGLDRYGLDRWLDRARSIESRLEPTVP